MTKNPPVALSDQVDVPLTHLGFERTRSGLLAETEGRQVGVEGVGLQLVRLEAIAQVGQVALDSSEGVRVCHRLNLARRGVSFSDGDQLR